MAKSLEVLDREVQEIRIGMKTIETLVDRLDITIDKLTEVSTNVSQLLAIQGSRLEFQEKNHNQLHKDFERRQSEINEVVSKIDTKVEKLQKNNKDEIKEIHEDVVNKIQSLEKNLNKTINDGYEKQDARITKLEKWMWVLIGAGGVLSFVINNVNMSALF